MAEDRSPAGVETRSCAELLHEASKALRYFEILEVRYLRWVGDATSPEFKPYGELHTLFYQQNGLNEEAFRTAADTLKTVLEKVATERNEQATFAHTLPTVWWGDAATAASNMMATQLQLAEADITIVRKVQEGLAAAPQSLRDALAIKTCAAAEISRSDEIEVRGKTPEDIDSIITFANGFFASGALWGKDTLVDKVNRIFPELAESGSLYVPWISAEDSTYVGKMREQCRTWLDEIFKTEYESHLAEFVKACNQTNQYVAGIHDELVKAFQGLNATKYPCPKISQTPQTTTPPGTATSQPTGTGAPTTPSTTTTPSATPPSTTTTTTPSTTPTGTDDPLSTVAALGTQLASSGLGTQLTEGLNALVSSASQQITSTLEQLREQAENILDPDGEDEPAEDLDGDGEPDQDTDGDGEPDEDLDGDGEPDEDADGDGEPDPGGDKGIEFNGRTYKLEVGSDGQLKLVVDSPTGDPVTYRVEIGPDGIPAIVGDDRSGETAPPETENPQPADRPSGVPGVPAGKQQDDGEHRPQDYPPPQQSEEEPAEPEPAAPPPAPPVETGAQLAEAGPL
ncbi:hypothetical protein [Nocardia sp. X0981]